MNNKAILITGGTGGHVLPSIAFGNYLIKNGYNAVIITDRRGKKYTSEFKGKIIIISASHLSGNLFYNIIGFLKLIHGLIQSFIFIMKFKPFLAISFGSYASLPPCFAIKFLKVFLNMKFYIHEQNSVIGKSNKYFLKYARKLFLNFNIDYNLSDLNKRKALIVGLPFSNIQLSPFSRFVIIANSIFFSFFSKISLSNFFFMMII